MKTSITFLSLLLIGLSSNALAADKSGFYVTGKIGTSGVKMSDQKLNITNTDFDINYNDNFGSKTKWVFGGGAALGYDFNEKFNVPIRTELDFMFRGKASANNNLFSISDVWGGSSADFKNEVTLNTFMLNGFYDFRNESAFTPYISAGIGLANLKHKLGLQGRVWDASDELIYNGHDSKSKTQNNFAWSLGLGVQYAINSDLSMDLSYRYLDAGKSTLSIGQGDDAIKSKVKAQSNDILLGITYRF